MFSQLIKFLIVGGIATIINYLVFYLLLNYFHIHYVISFMLGFLVGVAFGYFLNKSWTYKVTNPSNKYVIKYLMVYIVSLVLGMGLIYILVSILYFNNLVAEIITIIFTTITNFIGTKFLVFKS